MTDRIRTLTVTLDRDYRDDDADVIIQAIRMIKGVGTVDTHVVTGQDWMARSAVRIDIAGRLHDAVREICTPDIKLQKP